MKVALTFDLPASFDYRKIKKSLKELLKIESNFTFFVPGAYAHIYPELIEEILSNEHELGSLGFFGEDYSKISPGIAARTLEASKELLSRFYPVKAFRPPGLKIREELIPWVARFYSIESSRKNGRYENLARLKASSFPFSGRVIRFQLPLTGLSKIFLKSILKKHESIGISELAEVLEYGEENSD